MQPEQLRKNSYRKILLRRSIEEVYINAYNLSVLRLWRGNMDVQPADKEMLLQYICKYTAKSAETEIPVTAEIQMALFRKSKLADWTNSEVYVMMSA